ncbi:MAG: S16 family serine protease [Acidimicrobiia bacterium]
MRKRIAGVLCTTLAFATLPLSPAVAGARASAAGSAPKSVVMHPLYYRQLSETKAQGGYATITITMTSGTRKPLRVAISEDSVGGTGDQWRAASWSAATAALLAVGADLEGIKFEIEIQGHIDGPSAGGLMTVGMLSLLRGDRLKNDVAMTGTINPDGTIGPVGGIPYKLDGVKKLKAKRFIVPIGQSIDTDLAGNEVDVKARAAKAGIAVGEVDTIQKAYATFTGKVLPKPLAPKGNPRFSTRATGLLEGIVAKLRTSAESKQVSLADAIAQANSLASVQDDVDELMAKASDAESNGELAIATTRYAQVVALVTAVENAAGDIAGIESGALSLADFIAGLDEAANSASDELDAFADDLASRNPRNVQQGVTLVSGIGELVATRARVAAAVNTLNSISDALAGGDDPATLVSPAVRSALALYATPVLVPYVLELTSLSWDLPGSAFSPKSKVSAIANFMRQFGDSELAAFDSLVVSETATAQEVTPDAIRSQLETYDTEYLPAVMAKQQISEIEDSGVSSARKAWLILGNAYALAGASNQLLSAGYSYGAERDSNQVITSIRNSPALEASLRRGNEQLRAAIALYSRNKSDPFRLVASLQVAEERQDSSDPDDQIEAASSYLQAFLVGRIGAYLGGYQKQGYAVADGAATK